MDAEKVKAFLTELGELTRRHGIKIGGCGCCGSPYLTEFEEGSFYACDIDDQENLNWTDTCISTEVCGDRASL